MRDTRPEAPVGDTLWERLRAAVDRLGDRGRADPRAAAGRRGGGAALLRGRAGPPGRAEAPLVFLAFNRGGTRFGIPVEQVLEAQELASFSRVPRAPPFLPGVIHWR